MPDPTLCENGEDCPACALRRAEDPWQRGAHPCNRCGGTGRIAWPVARIVANHVAEARALYWPAFDKRVGE